MHSLFFKQMYKYHYNRGLPGIALTQVSEVLVVYKILI
jgi:hypothetical protein